MKWYWVISLLLTTMIGNSVGLAVEPTRSLATDNRIRVVAYQADNVVPIDATTFTTTQIVFGKAEVIDNIQNGDVDAWTVSVPRGLGNMLFLKPTILGSNTNMTVVTNQHTYYFHLISHQRNTKTVSENTYAIHFIYPAQRQAKLMARLRYNQLQQRAIVNAAKNPERYHWNYSFSGARVIMPLHIFDDGRFTYMQLRAHQPIPAVFAVTTATGQESVVNYRRDGQYLVIQRIAPQFTLRDGSHIVASVFNNRLIHQRRQRGET